MTARQELQDIHSAAWGKTAAEVGPELLAFMDRHPRMATRLLRPNARAWIETTVERERLVAAGCRAARWRTGFDGRAATLVRNCADVLDSAQLRTHAEHVATGVPAAP